MVAPGRLYLPQRAVIDSYGEGGFHFADMSHRGSLLGLPSGMHAWPVTEPLDMAVASFAGVLEEADEIDFLIIGCGRDIRGVPADLRWRFSDAGIRFDIMTTNAAVPTWNILLDEGRRVAAALVAVP